MRLLELILSGINLEELRQFYVGVLGMRELEPYWTGRLAVQAGQTRLVFVPADPGAHPRYHFAFDVPSARFDEAVRWLNERGGLIADLSGKSHFHSDSWNADMVYFRDPQGNILELIARHDLPAEEAIAQTRADDFERQRANRPFSALEIIGITEIGLATNSVPDTIGALQERMPGLKGYDRMDDTFAALGDIHGLFIVVRRGRIWFPDTAVPADFLPFSAYIELAIGRRYRISAPPFPFSTQAQQ